MSTEQEGRRRVRWNWRVAGIVAGLFVVIAGAVVVVDVVSVRDKGMWAKVVGTLSQPATLPQ